MTEKEFDFEGHVLRGYSLLEKSALRSENPELVREIREYLKEANQNVLTQSHGLPLYNHLRQLENKQIAFTSKEDEDRICKEEANKKMLAYLGDIKSLAESHGYEIQIPNKIEDLKIDKIGLSIRTLNLLERAKIINVGDLIVRTESELLRMKEFGRKSLNEINRNLGNYYRLSLKP